MIKLAIGYLIGGSIAIIIALSAIWVIEDGLKRKYEKGFNDGYHKYIESFIPAPMLPKEIPVKRRAKLMEKFKG